MLVPRTVLGVLAMKVFTKLPNELISVLSLVSSRKYNLNFYNLFSFHLFTNIIFLEVVYLCCLQLTENKHSFIISPIFKQILP